MAHRYFWATALLGLAACNGDKDTADTTDTDAVVEDTGDTGDTDTGDTGADCTAVIEDAYPLSGQAGWFYRDPMTVTFDQAVEGVVSYSMLADGAPVELSVTYDDSGFEATLLPSSGTWEGSTGYNLAVTLCGETTEYSFATSEYGGELESESSTLAGNTYFVDMSEATYSEPPGVGTLIRQFLTNPLLIDITAASDAQLSIIGAQGQISKTTAEVTQDTDYATWDFGNADFDTRPYFAAETEQTTFSYGGEDIPVYGFAFDGTFAPDGQKIGGMNFSGLGDTRNFGPLLGLGNNPEAACDLLTSVGVVCEACPDGGEYCVMLVGSFEDAELLPDVDVVVVE